MNRFITLFVYQYLFAAIGFTQIHFTESIIDGNTHGPACLYGCDLDGDLDTDILAAVIEENQIVWFENQGMNPIQWTKHSIGTGMLSAHSVHANDIDRDGNLDVLGTSYGSYVAWYRNNADTPLTFTRFLISSNFTQAHEVYSADIDGDNDIDVLAASSALNRIALWLNEGGDPIEWTEQIIDSACGMAKSVHAADVDNDGDLDVIAAALIDSDVKWYRNDGGNPITWTTIVIDGLFGGAHRVQGVDIDGDQDIDILAAGYTSNLIAWWRNNGGDPISWRRQIIGYGFTDACIAQASDIDNDGLLDVVGTAQGIDRICWWRNSGGDTITWTEHVVTSDFDRVWPLWAGDVDGDGDADIVAGSSYEGTNEVRLWLNEGMQPVDREDVEMAMSFGLTVSPNPFNNNTAIEFSLNREQFLRVQVYDMLGRLAATLAAQDFSIGSHHLDWNAADLASGSYNLVLENDSGVIQTTRIVLIR